MRDAISEKTPQKEVNWDTKEGITGKRNALSPPPVFFTITGPGPDRPAAGLGSGFGDPASELFLLQSPLLPSHFLPQEGMLGVSGAR